MTVGDGLWHKDAIFYELHVRAFKDGNDDGIGDFTGLTSQLDYLKELGVDCLWLLPFFNHRSATTGTTSATTGRSIPTTARWRTSSDSSKRPTPGASA